MNTLYKVVRKIHRILVLVVTIFLLIMGFTGLALKYPGVANAMHWIGDTTTLRSVHNSLSLLFALTLLLMVLTGILMYILPPLIRRQFIRRPPPPPAN